MRWCRLILLLCVGMLFCFGKYCAPSDDTVHFGLLRPTNVIAIKGHGARALLAQVRDFAQDLVAAVGNPQRERVKGHLPTEAVHQ